MKTQGKIARVAFAIIATGLIASGCSSVKDTLGTNKYPPDEFAVLAKTPLIIPPVYNLRPPGIGNPRPHEVDTSKLAMKALFPDASLDARSAGEDALMQAAGTSDNADARSDLTPAAQTVRKGVFTEDILYDDNVDGGAEITVERLDQPPEEND